MTLSGLSCRMTTFRTPASTGRGPLAAFSSGSCLWGCSWGADGDDVDGPCPASRGRECWPWNLRPEVSSHYPLCDLSFSMFKLGRNCQSFAPLVLRVGETGDIAGLRGGFMLLLLASNMGSLLGVVGRLRPPHRHPSSFCRPGTGCSARPSLCLQVVEKGGPIPPDRPAPVWGATGLRTPET